MTEEEMADLAASICPRCECNVLASDGAQNALSRKDNETYVCSPCGEDEAVRDYIGIPARSWPIEAAFTFENLIAKMAEDSLLADLLGSGRVSLSMEVNRD
tara:strand:- start:550 stop:852 length:303 start_codon:yes stop_codon:yes gene_type:complete